MTDKKKILFGRGTGFGRYSGKVVGTVYLCECHCRGIDRRFAVCGAGAGTAPFRTTAVGRESEEGKLTT